MKKQTKWTSIFFKSLQKIIAILSLQVAFKLQLSKGKEAIQPNMNNPFQDRTGECKWVGGKQKNNKMNKNLIVSSTRTSKNS